jgi:hypothetical protein
MRRFVQSAGVDRQDGVDFVGRASSGAASPHDGRRLKTFSKAGVPGAGAHGADDWPGVDGPARAPGTPLALHGDYYRILIVSRVYGTERPSLYFPFCIAALVITYIFDLYVWSNPWIRIAGAGISIAGARNGSGHQDPNTDRQKNQVLREWSHRRGSSLPQGLSSGFDLE